jgi:heme iron utilization protein
MIQMALMMAATMLANDNKDVAELARGGKVAVLSTSYEGTPFGSTVGYALDADGTPLLYLSDMAVHSKNLKKKAASSLTVMKVDEDDVFNTARLTFVGKFKPVPKADVERVKKAFYARHKQAEDYEVLHDFKFYRMEFTKIHYIGGFGDIRWVAAEDYHKAFKAED